MPDSDSRGRPPARPGRLSVEVVAPPRVRATGLRTWLAAVAPARARGAVTVAVVPDARVRRLNRDYRAKDAATDVLSFPAAAPATPTRKRVGGPGPSARVRGKPDERGMLGDIVIAEGVARRQAREAGHAFGTELRVLALHGLLHLLGYDHERDGGRMARMEQRLRLKGGLHQGLIERGTRSRP